jgi:predicted GNAT superfamily acetyltransferase
MADPRWTFRHLTSQKELRACVEFQKRIWGENFGDVVPAAILWVAIRTGGIVAGAFDGDGAMAGFVFGLAGIDGRGPFHWSDMLAVRHDLRGQGLGRALKAFQRDDLLARGIVRSRWTFDPLEAGNAHFNLNVLGATSHEYVPDCYGESTSPLHAGLPTDRLIMDWQLDSARVRSRMACIDGAPGPADAPEAADAAVINPDGREPDAALSDRVLLLEVPPDAQRLKREDPAAALRWRYNLRSAFEDCFGRGYTATDVVRRGDRTYYVLRR